MVFLLAKFEFLMSIEFCFTLSLSKVSRIEYLIRRILYDFYFILFFFLYSFIFFLLCGFQDLDEWTLRISWLDLHLMYEQQKSNPQELNAWLDNVAQAAIEVFHLNHDQNQSSLSHSLTGHRSVGPL